MVTGRILAASLAASGVSHATSHIRATTDIAPSLDIAKSRGPQIFNAVHDSMRQWGASLHHNGMSFFLATVPEGVILHHGNNQEESPDGPDWLAYEIEHAENFARGGRGPPPGGPGEGPGHGYPGGPPPFGQMEYGTGQYPLTEDQSPVELKGSDQDTSAAQRGGWLHTYRATRPLRYLYVDGMGGGKTDMGTLDSQDYILRAARTISNFDQRKTKLHHKRNRGPMDERARAAELCALCKDWKLSGVIRMEAGFEIIQCDFTDGLEEIQTMQRPDPADEDGRHGPEGNFEYMRGLSERYDGIGSSRTVIDYSSMVSAYFFPINITNPDPKRPDLPRLSNATDAELATVQKWLNATISANYDNRARTIDWQDVTDLIVGRYADRIKFMAEKTTSSDQIASELKVLLTVFIDYSGKDQDQSTSAIERCTNFYLHGVEPVTESDELVHAAVQATSHELCAQLFEARKIVIVDTDMDESEKFSQARSVLKSLMASLHWARFKRCSACDVDEVCMIPMWPMGTKESYESPSCVNATGRGEGESYWGHRGPGGGRGPGRGGPGRPPPPQLA